MDREQAARAEVERIRAEARQALPREEQVPDPARLPPLPEAAIEFPVEGRLRPDEPWSVRELSDHIPDSWVDEPPLSIAPPQPSMITPYSNSESSMVTSERNIRTPDPP